MAAPFPTTYRWWLNLGTSTTPVPANTVTISFTRANGQVQDTRTTTATVIDNALLAAEATGTPQVIG